MEYGKSKYELLKEMIALKISTPSTNVDIFTVINHPTLSNVIDVIYAVYCQPAKLDEIIADAIEEVSGLNIVT